MSVERQIPGGPYAIEVTQNQEQIPGLQYLIEGNPVAAAATVQPIVWMSAS